MDAKLEGDKLTLVITLKPGTPSASGKTLVVASSGGFVGVPDSDVKFSLNVVKPLK